MEKRKEIRLVLPEEKYAIMEWQEEGMPVVAAINTSLKSFEPKQIFSWHLSLIIDFVDVVSKGMPSKEELAVIDPFCDKLDEEIKAGGNALFLIRETWKGTRRLVWRVYEPKIAHEILQKIIKSKTYPRKFDYYMNQDIEWKEAKFYLDHLK